MGEAFVLLSGPEIRKCQGGFDERTCWLVNSYTSFKAHLVLLRPHSRIFPRLLVASLASSSPPSMTWLCLSPSRILFSHPEAPHCLQDKVRNPQPGIQGLF